MAENNSFKAVGGILAAELFPVATLASADDIIEGGGIEVELADYASHYDESFSSDNGLVSVEHTLTLVAERANAGKWIDAEFLRHCAVEGVAARVWLATGEVLTMGWSPRFGFEQALRLDSVKALSGSRPKHRPRVELTLSSRDLHSAYSEDD